MLDSELWRSLTTGPGRCPGASISRVDERDAPYSVSAPPWVLRHQRPISLFLGQPYASVFISLEERVSPLRGGEAAKFGERYEGRWTTRQLLYVLLGDVDSVTVEDVGEISLGAEFTVWRARNKPRFIRSSGRSATPTSGSCTYLGERRVGSRPTSRVEGSAVLVYRPTDSVLINSPMRPDDRLTSNRSSKMLTSQTVAYWLRLPQRKGLWVGRNRMADSARAGGPVAR